MIPILVFLFIGYLSHFVQGNDQSPLLLSDKSQSFLINGQSYSDSSFSMLDYGIESTPSKFTDIEPSISDIGIPYLDQSIDKLINKDSLIQDGSLVSLDLNLDLNYKKYEKLSILSNLLTSPVMERSLDTLEELDFDYSQESLRKTPESIHKSQLFKGSTFKILWKNGIGNYINIFLRFGLLVAIVEEFNFFFKQYLDSNKCMVPTSLLRNKPWSVSRCISEMNLANELLSSILFTGNKDKIFNIFCSSIKDENSKFLHNWKAEISNAIKSIQTIIAKNIASKSKKTIESSISRNISKKNIEVNLPTVPKVVVTGNQIRKRYSDLMKHIELIRSKEKDLFSALIFDKKMAILITTLFKPNSKEAVDHCITILKKSNPALFREHYQQSKLMHICKLVMGDEQEKISSENQIFTKKLPKRIDIRLD
ncbi:hypothetical protein cand_036190 [Cryptosporidium andersoni]|uniref:Uncharacterized protein n=1 Tax=Cryptosporidium andersoni TaxID=117008 RepID=A0A1J4MVJ3_9CRYT|nr:hypothetical protein cand_036190 [Cryptosporidium andersoni]